METGQTSTVRLILFRFRGSTSHLEELFERTKTLCHASHCHLSPLCFLQVMYSQDKHSRPSVVETNSTSLELSLPVNQDYIIQIKPFSEGGEGSSSRQITIPKIAGGNVKIYSSHKQKFSSLIAFWSFEAAPCRLIAIFDSSNAFFPIKCWFKMVFK